jgi:hypothetical protein
MIIGHISFAISHLSFSGSFAQKAAIGSRRTLCAKPFPKVFSSKMKNDK